MAAAGTDTPAALLGLRIMTLLHRQGMSVYMLAKRADVPLRTVQRIVAGEGKQPSVWTIAAIARVLSVSMDDLAALHGSQGETRTTQSTKRSRKAAPVAQ